MTRPGLTVGLFVLAYASACLLDGILPLVPAAVAVPWLASGVLLGAFVRVPLRQVWPMPLVAAAIGALSVLDYSAPAFTPRVAFAGAQIVACFAAALAFRLVTRRGLQLPAAIDFGRTRPVLEFFGLSAACAVLIVASNAAILAGQPIADPAQVWSSAIVAHLLGIVVVAPLWLLPRVEWDVLWRAMTPARSVEFIAAMTGLLAALIEVYWSGPVDTPRAYFLLPSLMWLALRFRVPGACVGMLVAAIAAVAATDAGLGLYAGVAPDRIATGLPGLLVVGSICFLSLAATVTQVRRTSAELDTLNRSLAAEVEKQTASLTTAMTRLRLAVDGAEMGTWQWTVGTKEALVDVRQREILGLTPDGPLSADIVFSRIHPEDSGQMRGDFERWVRGGGPWVYEHRVRDADGHVRWVAGRAVLVRDAEGRTVATGVTFDITRQKLEERGRRRVERQVRQLADCAPATLWATDRDGKTTFRSRDWNTLTGQHDDQGLEFGWLDRVHDDDRERVWSEVVAAHTLRKPFTSEYRVRAADGSLTWVLDSGRPLLSDDRTFQGLVGSVVDITELKKVSVAQRQVQAALRESNERFRQLADHLDAGLWVVEIGRRDGDAGETENRRQIQVQYVSSGFQRVWNIEHGSLGERGATWAKLVHADDRSRMRAAFDAYLDGSADYDIEYRINIPSGEQRWVHERAYTVSRDAEGGIRLVAGLTIDVTERHRVEQGLREADRQKDAFLAMLAHELRNPLAPIRTATDVLGMPGIDEATRGRVREIIERQVVHITRLVDDLLDVSRLSRGRLQLHRAPVNLVAVVQETVADYTRFLADAGLTVHVNLPDDSVWVDGDATRLAQILGNLLHNVRKFTPAGGYVRVALRAGDGQALLDVEDSGDGVSPDLMPRIFEPFSQGGQSLDRSPGGLGLGLSLVKGLVELHGGAVSVSSAGEGQGTQFSVSLPVCVPPETVPAPALQDTTNMPLAIVVVEDNVDAAETLRLLLTRDGHDVSVVHTAEAGIEAAARSRPDLVFCDIGLPGPLNGLDVARALCAEGTTARLVALTGYAGAEHVRAAEAAGFHHHITKPVGATVIRQVVADAFRARRDRPESPGLPS